MGFFFCAILLLGKDMQMSQNIAFVSIVWLLLVFHFVTFYVFFVPNVP